MKPPATSATAAPEPPADLQYSVKTDNKFDGVSDAGDDPLEMLEKLADKPKEKKAEKPAQKKKPASAPAKKPENAAASDKAKAGEKPKAQEPAGKVGDAKASVNEGGRGAARGGRGGRGGAIGAGHGDDSQQPPASAPVHREPPPPPKYDQPQTDGGAPRGFPRGRARGFGGGFGGFGGGYGGGFPRGAPRPRGGPRGGGPRPAFGEGAPLEGNAPAPAGGQEGVIGGGGAGEDFGNRAFESGGRRPGSGGYRGRGGFRGGRGRGGFRPEFGAPDAGGAGGAVPRKREFERHSGSDVTGVRPQDKREGAGAHNWGTMQDDLAGQTALNETEITEEGAAAPATGDQAAPAEGGAEAPKEGEGDKAGEGKPTEEEKKEFTLDEYKAQMQQKLAPKSSFNVRAPEGADLKGLKQVVKKKEDQTEFPIEDENAVEEDAGKKAAKAGKQVKAPPVKDVGFRYENPQADSGPRRGRGGFRGGFRGGYREEGGAPAAGGNAGFSGGYRGGRGGRGPAPPRLENEDDFPALNPVAH